MGPLTFGKKEEAIFLGREIAQHRDYSEDTAIRIDAEVKKIVVNAYNRARQTIEDNREAMERIAIALLEREVLDGSEIQLLVEGKPLPEKEIPVPPSEEKPAAATGPAAAPRPEPKPVPGFAKGEKPAPA
jgi:cell division protease FtsH